MENIQIQNEHYYRQIYGQWKDSNLGVKAFCEQQSIKYVTFRYWIRKCHQACSLRPVKSETSHRSYSPQSNGMCEALNGTFKRDYVYENCLDNPATVLSKIQEWVDEYNTFAPHSALNMKTPEEYFNFKLAA